MLSASLEYRRYDRSPYSASRCFKDGGAELFREILDNKIPIYEKRAAPALGVT
jgi:hypothetical protein